MTSLCVISALALFLLNPQEIFARFGEKYITEKFNEKKSQYEKIRENIKNKAAEVDISDELSIYQNEVVKTSMLVRAVKNYEDQKVKIFIKGVMKADLYNESEENIEKLKGYYDEDVILAGENIMFKKEGIYQFLFKTVDEENKTGYMTAAIAVN